MTPDEWKRVKAIAGEAWARPDAERIPYIISACADDEERHREVVSLVESMAAAEGSFEVSPQLPVDDIAALASLAGRRIGAYEILSRIGAGGMGEVYKARDTRLNRIVAIKALPARTSADRVSRERMEREARAVAALNHPHICTLYDIGSQDGLDFLVMEYVDGETLAVRLSRGRLPIAEALQYAEQIASALVEAHLAGIVHRDVKPANIILNHTGLPSARATQAKLLDFGVAKASPLDSSSGSMLPEPEGALDLTLPGFVPGTVQYMAPEQFDRGTADVRTDIFAFGAVLFEMLTGRKAFEGADRAEILAAIRHEERPRVSRLGPRLPAALDRIVIRCLARDPDERYQSIQDVLLHLRAVQRRLDSRSRVRTLALSFAVLALLIGGAITWVVRAGRDTVSTAAPSVTRLPASAGVLGAPAISPDGDNVVFSWAGDGVNNPELVLLRIGSTTRVRLTNDPGVEEWPVWSPDGARIAFVRCGPGKCGIFTLPVGGGPEHKVRDLRDDRYYGLAWSPDGRSIVYAERPTSAEPYGLFVLSLDTSVVRRLTTPPPGMGELRFAFSPDGGMLAVIRVANGVEVHVLSFDTGVGRVLLSGQREWFGGVTWSADGRDLILSANQQGVRRLWRLPVAGGSLQQVAIAGEDAYYPSVSAQSRLVFVREIRDWDISRMTLRPGKAPELAPFPSSTRLDLDPAFSPDGRKLAFVSERSGTREVWVSNADGTEPVQLTSISGLQAGRPSWSPDGRLLAFHAGGICVMDARAGTQRRITKDGEMPTWSADGQWIYFLHNDGNGSSIWKVGAAGGLAVQTVASEASAAREGPTGKEVYFAKIPGGIWRRSLTGGEEMPVVPDFTWLLPGYWAVFSDGIYYVVRQSLPDGTLVHHLRFFDFASRRATALGTLTGHIEEWVGGMTVSNDRRTVLYSQRTYQSREVMLVEHFR
jgi:eukaryotic-like serine/threonine-protein kinase